MKRRLLRSYSREEFERLTYPEKLQYLTDLLNALEPLRQPTNQANAPVGVAAPPEPSGPAAD